MGKTDHNAQSVYQLGVNPPADIAFGTNVLSSDPGSEISMKSD